MKSIVTFITVQVNTGEDDYGYLAKLKELNALIIFNRESFKNAENIISLASHTADKAIIEFDQSNRHDLPATIDEADISHAKKKYKHQKVVSRKLCTQSGSRTFNIQQI